MYFLRGGGWKTSKEYWEKRYKAGGNSGVGSYNRLAQFKADVINEFIQKHDIKRAIEWGCGDGNQLKYIHYPEYIGIDVSPMAVQICKKIFENDLTKKFYCSTTDSMPMEILFKEKADLTLSLDVIYHLLEEDVYIQYMDQLFSSSSKYVCIYSCNFEKQYARHVRCRKFTDYIDNNISNWKLIEKINNKFPYDDNDQSNTSWSDFYFFEKQ